MGTPELLLVDFRLRYLAEDLVLYPGWLLVCCLWLAHSILWLFRVPYIWLIKWYLWSLGILLSSAGGLQDSQKFVFISNLKVDFFHCPYSAIFSDWIYYRFWGNVCFYWIFAWDCRVFAFKCFFWNIFLLWGYNFWIPFWGWSVHRTWAGPLIRTWSAFT